MCHRGRRRNRAKILGWCSSLRNSPNQNSNYNPDTVDCLESQVLTNVGALGQPRAQTISIAGVHVVHSANRTRIRSVHNPAFLASLCLEASRSLAETMASKRIQKELQVCQMMRWSVNRLG